MPYNKPSTYCVSQMKLNQYLVTESITQSEFAKRVGVCQATVHKWLYGRSVPSGKRIMQIHSLTEGDVSIDDWVQQKGEDDASKAEN